MAQSNKGMSLETMVIGLLSYSQCLLKMLPGRFILPQTVREPAQMP